MFIICPKCAAKYKIPEGITLENGQKLKCSACDFVFLKGEEAPLVLEKQDKDTSVPSKEATLGEAFSIPLYTKADDVAETSDTLPTAFQPVSEPQKSKSSVFLILLYLILIAVLGTMAWMFRDSLRPDISDIIPPARSHQNLHRRPQKLPSKPMVQVEDDTVIIEELPVTAPKQTPQKNELKVKEIAPTEAAEQTESDTIRKPNQTEEITNQVNLPIPAETVKAESLEIPDRSVDLNMESFDEDIDTIPLFEAVPPQQPALTIDQISFRIEPGENGADQLLIEGELHNKSQEVKVIPELTILVFGKDGSVLVQKQIHLSEEQLQPEQAIPFFTGIAPAPTDIDRVDVKF